MKNTGFLSFNTGGTLGHSTLLTNLANFLSKKSKVHILSDQIYNQFSKSSNPEIIWWNFDKQEHLKSNGGCVSIDAKQNILNYIIENKIENVVYSTFFDPGLVNELSKQDIKNIYISYPLRDTFTELFFLREYDDVFDDIIILNDLYNNKYSDAVKRSSPFFPKQHNKVCNSNKILATCGGGGRPSSKNFLNIFRDYCEKIKKEYEVDITLIKGPNNVEFGFQDIKVIEYTNKILEYIDQSDIVISEAGYFSTHELIARSTPSILIPGERRIDNQELRAIGYEKNKLGYCYMPQEDISVLIDKSVELLKNKSLRTDFINNNKQYYFDNINRHSKIEQILESILK